MSLKPVDPSLIYLIPEQLAVRTELKRFSWALYYFLLLPAAEHIDFFLG